MHLVEAVFHYLRLFPILLARLLVSFFVLSATEIASMSLLTVPQTEGFLIKYGTLFAFSLLWKRHAVFHAKLNLVKRVEVLSSLHGWQKYEALDITAKMSIPIDEYREKLNDATAAIRLFIDWGIHEIFTVTVGLSVLFFVSSLRGTLVTMVLSSLASYYFLFAHAEQQFRSKFKTLREQSCAKRRCIRQRTDLLLLGHTTTHDVGEMLEQCANIQIESDAGWNDMARNIDYCCLANFMVLIPSIVYSSASPTHTVVLLTSFGTLCTRISWLMRFMHSFKRNSESYDAFDKIHQDNKSRATVAQLDFPDDQIRVNSLLVAYNDAAKNAAPFSMRLDTPFEFGRGDRIVVTGPSGGGKTTFIHALQGRLRGAVLEEYDNPASFMGQFVELHEHLHNLPIAKATVRSLCVQKRGAAFDEHLARKCLDICSISVRDFDAPFEGKISSGEKSRIVLALLVLYPFIQRNKSVLVLDEPERSMDPPLAYNILQRIFEWDRMRTKAIFLITHLEHVHTRLQYNKRIVVEGGGVTTIDSKTKQTPG